MSPGDVLARRYSLEARLGRGGMGEVWSAVRLDTQERVAVKLLNEELAASDSSRRRFLREARLASSVSHPNVVEMYDVVEDDALPFLVMELLSGETLGARLRRKGKLSPAETAAILLPVLDAVEAAHAAGIVHRDLKPENVFVAEDGAGVRVRVLDFGIAKQTEKLAEPMGDEGATTAPVGTTGAMMGTPFYMSPEQALGERDVDARADLWALGIIAYECLSGKRPTDAATLGGVLKIIVTDGIAPLDGAAPGVDPDVARAVMALLRTDRAARAPSLVALRTALRALAPESATLDLPAIAARPDRPKVVPSSRRALWVAGGAVAILGLGGIAFAVARPGAPPEAPVSTQAIAASAGSSGAVATAASSTPATSATASAAPSSSATAARSAPHPTARASANVAPLPSATGAPSSSAAPALSRGAGGLVADNPFTGH